MNDTKELLLTKEETARLLRISTTSLYRLVKSGAISTVRVGKHCRFNAKEVSTYINEQSQQTKTETHDSGNH